MYRIIIFGDSIAAGRAVNKNKSWPFLISHFMDKINNREILVYNLSVASTSTKEIIQRFENESSSRLINQDPDDQLSIIFAIGLNDSKGIGSQQSYYTKPKDFKRNVLLLIKLAKKFTKDIIYIGPNCVDENKTSYIKSIFFKNRNVQKFNNSIQLICQWESVTFINSFKEMSSGNFEEYLVDDGIHLNELGHRFIFERLIQHLGRKAYINLDSYNVLQKELQLTDLDLQLIKSKFSETRITNNPLFMGKLGDEEPDIIIGAVCIRKDIEDISLNTFYQIFMPMIVAKNLNLPCKIFIGIEEEIIFQPELTDQYLQLGSKLKAGINNLSKILGIETEVVNTTSSLKYNLIIDECIKTLNINLSLEDSMNLYNLSNRSRTGIYPLQRIISNKRVIACNTAYALEKLFGKNHKFLIVEDIVQYKAILYAQKFDNLKPPNFLAFLPLSNTDANSDMFKAEEESSKIYLNSDRKYYQSVFKRVVPDALANYMNFFCLIQTTSGKDDFEYFYKAIIKISKVFE